eukprot:2103277-Amphidinium_carterae.1
MIQWFMRIVRETRPRAISPPAGQCQVSCKSAVCYRESELLPMLLARRAWRQTLGGRKVLVLVDSQAAKHICVGGSSSSKCCLDP